jgi:hypothetical protein
VADWSSTDDGHYVARLHLRCSPPGVNPVDRDQQALFHVALVGLPAR